MPVERVTPAEGAQRVRFDYDAADAALTWATRTLPSAVADVLDPYDAAATAAVDDWSGVFRRQFDDARGNLRDRLGLVSGMGDLTVADAVLRAVDDANDLQRAYNAEADAPPP
jgi:hypothetical protein